MGCRNPILVGGNNRTTVYPTDSEGLHKLACYFMRPPVNLSRLRYHRDSQLLLYEPKTGQEVDRPSSTLSSFSPVSSSTSPSPTSTWSISTGPTPTACAKPTGQRWKPTRPGRRGKPSRRPQRNSEQTVEGSHLPHLRGGPSDLLSLRGKDENSRFHHRPQSPERPERHPHSDLLRPLAHDIGNDAVDSDGAEKDRER